MKKRKSKKFKSLKRNFNIIVGTIIFILLIGTAFSIDWIFGVGFIISFLLSVYNKILEKNFLIPIFIFIGILIIRYAIFLFLPSILNAQNYFSLGISLVLFLIILIVGWRIKKGNWKSWRIDK